MLMASEAGVCATRDLAALLRRRLTDAAPPDAEVAALVAAILERCGAGVQTVLLYGSYLRGARDTLLDFYVVVDDYASALGSRWSALGAFLLPPNVYYLVVPGADGQQVRAKYAVVTARQLRRHVRGLHPYFWARFTQPCRLVYGRDDQCRGALRETVAMAVETFVQRVTPYVGSPFTAAEFWNQGFAKTYRAELRAESAERVASLFDHDPDYYAGLLSGFGFAGQSDGSFAAPALAARSWYWPTTIALGKVLSV